eukprot:8185622-Alexandrium_andersonii.AAC.1
MAARTPRSRRLADAVTWLMALGRIGLLGTWRPPGSPRGPRPAEPVTAPQASGRHQARRVAASARGTLLFQAGRAGGSP